VINHRATGDVPLVTAATPVFSLSGKAPTSPGGDAEDAPIRPLAGLLLRGCRAVLPNESRIVRNGFDRLPLKRYPAFLRWQASREFCHD